MTKNKKTPENSKNSDPDPGTENSNHKRRQVQFEETSDDKIPYFGVERLTQDDGPDGVGGSGPDDI